MPTIVQYPTAGALAGDKSTHARKHNTTTQALISNSFWEGLQGPSDNTDARVRKQNFFVAPNIFSARAYGWTFHQANGGPILSSYSVQSVTLRSRVLMFGGANAFAALECDGVLLKPDNYTNNQYVIATGNTQDWVEKTVTHRYRDNAKNRWQTDDVKSYVAGDGLSVRIGGRDVGVPADMQMVADLAEVTVDYVTAPNAFVFITEDVQPEALFQRNGGAATVPIPLTYYGSPDSIEYRHAGGTWQPYGPYGPGDTTPPPVGSTGSTITYDMVLPTGDGLLEVRALYGAAGYASDSRENIAVGDLWLCMGASNMVGYGDRWSPVTDGSIPYDNCDWRDIYDGDARPRQLTNFRIPDYRFNTPAVAKAGIRQWRVLYEPADSWRDANNIYHPYYAVFTPPQWQEAPGPSNDTPELNIIQHFQVLQQGYRSGVPGGSVTGRSVMSRAMGHLLLADDTVPVGVIMIARGSITIGSYLRPDDWEPDTVGIPTLYDEIIQACQHARMQPNGTDPPDFPEPPVAGVLWIQGGSDAYEFFIDPYGQHAKMEDYPDYVEALVGHLNEDIGLTRFHLGTDGDLQGFPNTAFETNWVTPSVTNARYDTLTEMRLLQQECWDRTDGMFAYVYPFEVAYELDNMTSCIAHYADQNGVYAEQADGVHFKDRQICEQVSFRCAAAILGYRGPRLRRCVRTDDTIVTLTFDTDLDIPFGTGRYTGLSVFLNETKLTADVDYIAVRSDPRNITITVASAVSADTIEVSCGQRNDSVGKVVPLTTYTIGGYTDRLPAEVFALREAGVAAVLPLGSAVRERAAGGLDIEVVMPTIYAGSAVRERAAGGLDVDVLEFDIEALSVEGFSISHVAILDGVTSADETLPGFDVYGVREASLEPDVEETESVSDDGEVGLWNFIASADLTVVSGYIDFDVLADMTGVPVTEAFGTGDINYMVDLWHEDSFTLPPRPVLIRVPARDNDGRVMHLDLVLYRVQFTPISFDGPRYKDGLALNYHGKATLSTVDEVGGLLPDRSFGRLVARTPA